MKRHLVYTCILLALVMISCNPQENRKQAGKMAVGVNYGEPSVKPAIVLKDLMSFLVYRQKNLKLYEDFIALDTSSGVISKKDFLKSLASGLYVPLKLQSPDSSTYYKLYTIGSQVNKNIVSTITYWGQEQYAYFQTVGTQFPDFAFTDLDGNRYTKASMNGKIVVVKCWFIGCLPCVKEMPALNTIKQQYADRKDIVFLSLCLDSKQEVQAFLKKKTFTYAVIPEQHIFIKDSLQVHAYPTHFIINRQGQITKKTNDYKEMMYMLQKEGQNL